MDGVLVDTETLKFKAYQKLLEKIHGVKSFSLFNRYGWQGRTEEHNAEYFIKKYYLSVKIEEFIKEKRSIYQALLGKELKLIDGIRDLLDWLSDKKWPLALATSTNKKSMDYIMKKFDLGRYFISKLSKEDVSNHKPAPDVYLKSAEILKVQPNTCLMFEDTPTGIEAAKRAGMKCIAITTTYTKEYLSQADLIIDSYQQLDMNNLGALIKNNN